MDAIYAINAVDEQDQDEYEGDLAPLDDCNQQCAADYLEAILYFAYDWIL